MAAPSTATVWDRAYELLNAQLFAIGGRPVTLTTVLSVILVLLATFWVSRLVRATIHRGFKRRNVREGTSAAVARLVHYVFLIVGLSIALQTMGIDLGALFAAGAIFAVALGFAMQTIVQNFVSGVILLVEQSIKPHDILGLENKLVRVQAMRIRSTIVETWDGEQLVVPNSALVQSTVKNYTLHNTVVRVRAKVGVSYGSDMALVQRTLEATGENVPWRKPETEAQVLFAGMGTSSVDWELAVWVEDPWLMRQRLSELNRLIWDACKAAHITIAFPQVDVHFDAPVEKALAQLAPVVSVAKAKS